MDNLYEEYQNYNKLIETKKNLNDELLSLSGINDEQSISRINEIGGIISGINDELKLYNEENVKRVQEYFKGLEDVKRVTDEIQTIEKLSKKSKGDKIETLSSEGRKKYIDKQLVEEYNQLAKIKKELRQKNLQSYRSLKDMASIIIAKKEEVKEEVKESPLVKKEKVEEKEISLEDRLKECYERLDRIFKSTNLPNQGKKEIVTYKGVKHSIPSKYIGRYRETTREISHLLNLIKAKDIPKEPSVEDIPKEEASIEDIQDIKQDNLVEYMNDNRITLIPLVNVSFSDTNRASLNNAFTGVRNKKNTKSFKEILSNIYNIDKEIQLGFLEAKGDALDDFIEVRDEFIRLKEGVTQKINASKNYIGSVSKKAIKPFKDKIDIIAKRKENGGLKSSMEKVYGDEKEKHLDYRIVNRVANFKKDTCIRIDETKGKIADVNRSFIRGLKAPFDKMRETLQNDAKRNELKAMIEEVKIENRRKAAYIRSKTIESNGYILSTLLISSGIILLIVFIYMSIKIILY